MDYPFFTRKLCSISEELLSSLALSVEGQPTQQHPSFTQVGAIAQQVTEVPHPLLERLLSECSEWLPPDTYSGQSVNVIPASTAVKEHCDGWYSSFNSKVQHSHCIHVPLKTNKKCLTFHRRDPHVVAVPGFLEPGFAWAYNNYVRHSIVNGSKEPRTHLILYFNDPLWTTKEKMMKKLGLQGHQLYEEQ